jgi:hypothetical protein
MRLTDPYCVPRTPSPKLTATYVCDREDSGKPKAGKRHVRYDEGGGGHETGLYATRPFNPNL